MKRVVLFFMVLYAYTAAFSQTAGTSDLAGFGSTSMPTITAPNGKLDTASKWTNSLTTRLNLSQVGFSNWKSGGENSLTWVGIIDGKYIYRDSTFDWRTQNKFAYGQTKQGKTKFKKNDDLIDISSVVSYMLGFKIDPYFSVSLRSQFGKGYNYIGDSAVAVSNFFDPGYITQNLGFQYLYGTIFDIRMGFSLKETYSRKFTNYTDDLKTIEIEKVKVQPGAELVSNYTNKFDDKLSIKSQFELFTNFKTLNQIDLRWDTYFSYKFYKHIELSFNFVMYYNRDESAIFQWKEIIGLGLVYDIL